MMNDRISDIMDRDVPTLQADDTLGEARTLLLQKGTHHLPILEGQKLVGLITTWDIFKLGKSVADYQNMKCRELMTTHLAVLEPHELAGAAAEVLMEHLFHAIPIVDDDHNFVGMVDSYDVVKYEYKKEYPQEAAAYA